MTAPTPEIAAVQLDKTDAPSITANEVEAEIRDFVRRDMRHLRRAEPTGEAFASNINSLVQRVAGTSLREIDNLVRELEGVREFLQGEGERVQREVANYAQLSQAAMNSTRIISESMSQWRKQVDATRSK
jgi:hypothetical protein